MSRKKQPQIGSTVTLISSLDVRYEGVLFTIDPNESTVALQNVKCLGTEDRQPPGEKAIPKSDTMYEFIIFRGQNIKSISCVDHTRAPVRPPISDPSILKIGEPTEVKENKKIKVQSHQTPHRNHGRPRYNNPNRFDYNASAGKWQPSNGRGNYGYNNRQRSGYNGYNYNNNYRYARRGGQRNYRRGGQRNYRYQYNRRNLNPEYAPGSGKFLTKSQANNNVESIEETFNFEEGNKRFDKAEFLQEAQEAEQKENVPEPKVEEVVEENSSTEENKLNKADPTQVSTTKSDNEAENKVEPKEEKDEEKTEESDDKSKKLKPLKLSDSKYDPTNSFFDELDDGRQPPEHADASKRREKDVKTFGNIAQSYVPKVFRRRRYPRNNRGYNNWKGGYAGRGRGRGRGQRNY